MPGPCLFKACSSKGRSLSGSEVQSPTYRNTSAETKGSMEKTLELSKVHEAAPPPYEEQPSASTSPLQEASSSTSATTLESLGKRGPKLSDIPIDPSKPLNPNRVFWLPFFSTFSSTIKIHDISDTLAGHWQGAVNKEYRELAAAMYQKYHKGGDDAVYRAQATDKLHHEYHFLDRDGKELVRYKHGWYSHAKCFMRFSADSKYGATEVEVIRANKSVTRDRVFVLEGVMYSVEMDATWRSNQWSLYKLVDGKKYPVARYGSKFGNLWFTGGCLAVDNKGLDETVAILCCLIVVRQKKQRAAEGAGGGGGGG